MTELLPCPFCGRKDVDYCYSAYEGEPASTWVECDCGAAGNSVRGQDELSARRFWNTRACLTAALATEVAGEPVALSNYGEYTPITVKGSTTTPAPDAGLVEREAIAKLRDDCLREAAKTDCYTCYRDQAAEIARRLNVILSTRTVAGEPEPVAVKMMEVIRSRLAFYERYKPDLTTEGRHGALVLTNLERDLQEVFAAPPKPAAVPTAEIEKLRDDCLREAAKTADCYTCYTDQAAYMARRLDAILALITNPQVKA